MSKRGLKRNDASNNGRHSNEAVKHGAKRKGMFSRLLDRLFELPSLMTSMVKGEDLQLAVDVPFYGVDKLEQRVLLSATLNPGQWTEIDTASGPNDIIAFNGPAASTAMINTTDVGGAGVADTVNTITIDTTAVGVASGAITVVLEYSGPITGPINVNTRADQQLTIHIANENFTDDGGDAGFNPDFGSDLYQAGGATPGAIYATASKVADTGADNAANAGGSAKAFGTGNTGPINFNAATTIAGGGISVFDGDLGIVTNNGSIVLTSPFSVQVLEENNTAGTAAGFTTVGNVDLATNNQPMVLYMAEADGGARNAGPVNLASGAGSVVNIGSNNLTIVSDFGGVNQSNLGAISVGDLNFMGAGNFAVQSDGNIASITVRSVDFLAGVGGVFDIDAGNGALTGAGSVGAFTISNNGNEANNNDSFRGSVVAFNIGPINIHGDLSTAAGTSTFTASDGTVANPTGSIGQVTIASDVNSTTFNSADGFTGMTVAGNIGNTGPVTINANTDGMDDAAAVGAITATGSIGVHLGAGIFANVLTINNDGGAGTNLNGKQNILRVTGAGVAGVVVTSRGDFAGVTVNDDPDAAGDTDVVNALLANVTFVYDTVTPSNFNNFGGASLANEDDGATTRNDLLSLGVPVVPGNLTGNIEIVGADVIGDVINLNALTVGTPTGNAFPNETAVGTGDMASGVSIDAGPGDIQGSLLLRRALNGSPVAEWTEAGSDATGASTGATRVIVGATGAPGSVVSRLSVVFPAGATAKADVVWDSFQTGGGVQGLPAGTSLSILTSNPGSTDPTTNAGLVDLINLEADAISDGVDATPGDGTEGDGGLQMNVAAFDLDVILGQSGADGTVNGAGDAPGFIDTDNEVIDGLGVVGSINITGPFVPNSVIEVESVGVLCFQLGVSAIDPWSLISPLSLPPGQTLAATNLPGTAFQGNIPVGLMEICFFSTGTNSNPGSFDEFFAIGNPAGTKTLSYTVSNVVGNAASPNYKIGSIAVSDGDMWVETSASVAEIRLTVNAPGTDISHIEVEESVGQVVIIDGMHDDMVDTASIGSISVGFDTRLLNTDEAVTSASFTSASNGTTTSIVDRGFNNAYDAAAPNDDYVLPAANLGGVYVEGSISAADSTLKTAVTGATIAVSGNFGPLGGGLPALPVGFSSTNALQTVDVEPNIGFLAADGADTNANGSGTADSYVNGSILVGGDGANAGFRGNIDIAGGFQTGGVGVTEQFDVGFAKILAAGANGIFFTADDTAETFADGSFGAPGANIQLTVAGVFGDTRGTVGGFHIGPNTTGVDGRLTLSGDGIITADSTNVDIVVNNAYSLGNDGQAGGGGLAADITLATRAGIAAGKDYNQNGDATEESDDLNGSLTVNGVGTSNATGQYAAGDDIGSAAADFVVAINNGSYGVDVGQSVAHTTLIATGASPGDVYFDIVAFNSISTLIAAGTGEGGNAYGSMTAQANDAGGIRGTVVVANDDVGDASGFDNYTSAGYINALGIASGTGAETTNGYDGIGNVLVDVYANGGNIDDLVIRSDGNTGINGTINNIGSNHPTGNLIQATGDITDTIVVAEGQTIGNFNGINIPTTTDAFKDEVGEDPRAFKDVLLDDSFDSTFEMVTTALADEIGVGTLNGITYVSAGDGDASAASLTENYYYSIYAGGSITDLAILADGQIGLPGEGTSYIRALGNVQDIFLFAGLNDSAETGEPEENVLVEIVAGYSQDQVVATDFPAGTGSINTNSGGTNNVILADDNIGLDSQDGTIDSPLIAAALHIQKLIMAAGTDSIRNISQMEMAGNTMGVPDDPTSVDSDPTADDVVNNDEGGNIWTSVVAGTTNDFDSFVGPARAIRAGSGNIGIIYEIADNNVGATDGTDDVVASGNITQATFVAGFGSDSIGNFLIDVFAGVYGQAFLNQTGLALALGIGIDQQTGALIGGPNDAIFDGQGYIHDISVRADGNLGRVDGSSDIAAQDEILDVNLVADGGEQDIRRTNLTSTTHSPKPGETWDSLTESKADLLGHDGYLTIDIGDNAADRDQWIQIDLNAGADFDSSVPLGGTFTHTALQSSDLTVNVAVADSWIGRSQEVPNDPNAAAETAFGTEGWNVWRADHDVTICYVDAGLNDHYDFAKSWSDDPADQIDNPEENFLVSIYAGVEQDGTTVPYYNKGVTPDLAEPGFGDPDTQVCVVGPAIFGQIEIYFLGADDNIGGAGQMENEGFIASASIIMHWMEAGGIVSNNLSGSYELIFPDNNDVDEGGSILVNIVAGWRGETSVSEQTQAGYLVDGAGGGGMAGDLLDGDIDEGNLIIKWAAADDDIGENPTLTPSAVVPHLPTYADNTGNVWSAAGGGLDGYIAIELGKLLAGQSFTSFSGESYGGISSVNTSQSVGDFNVDVVAGVERATWDPVRANINDVDTSVAGGALPELAGGVGRINPQTGKPGVKGDVYNDDILMMHSFDGGEGVEGIDGVIRVGKNLNINPLYGMPDMAPFIPDDPTTVFNPDAAAGETVGGFEGNGNFNSTFLAGSDIEVNVNIRGNFVGRDGVGGRAIVAAASYLGDGSDGSGTFYNPNMLTIRTADPGNDWIFMTNDDPQMPAIDGDFVGSLNAGAFVPFDNSGNNPFNANDRGPEQIGKVLTLAELKVGTDYTSQPTATGGIRGLDGGEGTTTAYDGAFNVGRIRGDHNGVNGEDGITLEEALTGTESLADRAYLGTTTFSSTDDTYLNVFVMGRPFAVGDMMDLLGGQAAEGTVTPNPADGDVSALSILSFGGILQGGFEKSGGADGTMGVVATDQIEFTFVLSNVDSVTAINTVDDGTTTFTLPGPDGVIDDGVPNAMNSGDPDNDNIHLIGSGPGDPSDPSTELSLNIGMGAHMDGAEGQSNDIKINLEAKGYGQGGIWGEMVAAGFDIFTRIDTQGDVPASSQAPVGSVLTLPKTPSFGRSFGAGSIFGFLMAEDQDPTNGLEVADIGIGFFGAGQDIGSPTGNNYDFANFNSKENGGGQNAGLIAQDDIAFYRLGTIGGHETDNDSFFLDHDGDGSPDADFDVAAGMNVNGGISPFGVGGLFMGGNNNGVFLAGDDIYHGRLEGSTPVPPVVIPGDAFTVMDTNTFDTLGFFMDGTNALQDTTTLRQAFEPSLIAAVTRVSDNAIVGLPANATLQSVTVMGTSELLAGIQEQPPIDNVAPFGIGTFIIANPSAVGGATGSILQATGVSTITGGGIAPMVINLDATVNEVDAGGNVVAANLSVPQNGINVGPMEQRDYIINPVAPISQSQAVAGALYNGNGTVTFTMDVNSLFSSTATGSGAQQTFSRNPQFDGSVKVTYTYTTPGTNIPGTPGGKKRIVREDKALFTVQGNNTPMGGNKGSFSDDFRLVSGIEDQVTSADLFDNFGNFIGNELEIDDDNEDGVNDGTAGDIWAIVIAGDDMNGIIDAGDTNYLYNGYMGLLKCPGGKQLKSGLGGGDFMGAVHAGAGLDTKILTVNDNDPYGDIDGHIRADGTIMVEDMGGIKGGILAEGSINSIRAGFGVNGGDILGNIVAEGYIDTIEVWGSLGRPGADSVVFAGDQVYKFLVGDPIMGDDYGSLRFPNENQSAYYNSDNEPQLNNPDFGVIYSDIFMGNLYEDSDDIYEGGEGSGAYVYIGASGGVDANANITLGFYSGIETVVTEFAGNINTVDAYEGRFLYNLIGSDGAPNIYAYYQLGDGSSDIPEAIFDDSSPSYLLEETSGKHVDIRAIGVGLDGTNIASINHFVSLDGLDYLHVVNGDVNQIIVDDDYNIRNDLNDIINVQIGTDMWNMFPFFTNSLPNLTAFDFAAHNSKTPIGVNDINVEYNIGVEGTSIGAGLQQDMGNYAVYIEGDLMGSIRSEAASVGNVVVDGRILDPGYLHAIWDAEVDDIGVDILVDQFNTGGKMTILAGNDISGESITVVLPAGVNYASIIDSGTISTGNGNGGTSGDNSSDITVLPDGSQIVTVVEDGDNGITFFGEGAGSGFGDVLIRFGAGDGIENEVSWVDAVGQIQTASEPHSKIVNTMSFAADFFARNSLGDIYVGVGSAQGHPLAVPQGNNSLVIDDQWVEAATNQFIAQTGSMGVLSVEDNIDNAVIDVSQSLGGLIARTGFIDQTIQTVHVDQSIGLLRASLGLEGVFQAEEGNIGVDLDLTDKFNTVTRQETTDAGIFSDLGTIAIEATAGGDIANSGAFVGSIDSTYIAGGSIGDLTAGDSIYGSYRATRGSIGDVTALTGDIGKQDERADFRANGGVVINPATLQYQHILDGEFKDGIGSIYSEIGNIYANVRTGTSVGVLNGNDVQGGIAAPIGNVEVKLNIGQHLGGISGANVSIDSDSIILGTTGVIRGADDISGAMTFIDADNDLLISSGGVDYIVDISNGNAKVTYSVTNGKVTFDEIVYTPGANGGTIDVTTSIFTGGTAQADSPTQAMVTNLIVSGSLTGGSVEGMVGTLAVGGSLAGFDVQGGVSDLSAASTSNVTIGGDVWSLDVSGNVSDTDVDGDVHSYVVGGNLSNSNVTGAVGTLSVTGNVSNVMVGSVGSLSVGGTITNLDIKDGGNGTGVIDIDPSLITVERLKKKGNTAAGGAVILTGSGDVLVSSFVTTGGKRIVTSVTPLSSNVTGLIINGRALSVDNTIDDAEFAKLLADNGGDQSKAQKSVRSNNGSTYNNLTVVGNVDQIVARGNISNLQVTGHAGNIDAGGSISNALVNGNVDVLKASKNISKSTVLGNVGSLSAGGTISSTVVAGSAIQVTGKSLNGLDIGGSVGIGVGEGFGTVNGLTLGAAFTPTTAAKVLGVAIGDSESETLANLLAIADVGPQGALFLGGIQASTVNNTGVGGAISDTVVDKSGRADNLVVSTVDDVFVRNGKNVIIKTDGVLAA